MGCAGREEQAVSVLMRWIDGPGAGVGEHVGRGLQGAILVCAKEQEPDKRVNGLGRRQLSCGGSGTRG